MKFIFIFLCFFVLFANASDKLVHNDITLGYGDSPEDFSLYRVSLKKDLNKYFFDNDKKYLLIVEGTNTLNTTDEKDNPGPIINALVSKELSNFRVPVMIVPGNFSKEHIALLT